MRIPDHYKTHNYFVYDGKPSLDFGLGISGQGTFSTPHRRVERFTVPGRHGTLTISDDTFEDVEITYPCYFADGFNAKYDALCSWLFSKKGMLRLEDTYHPEYFRLGEFMGDISPDMGTLNFSGKFDLTFRCDGRKFLKNGERLYIYTREDYDRALTIHPQYGRRVIVVNPTPYPAKPIIVTHGSGTFYFNDVEVTIDGDVVYDDEREESPYFLDLMWKGYAFDCESFEGYITSNMATSINHFITISGGEPVLMPGENYLRFNLASSGIADEFAIIPRWFTV